ncbi:hypothetical protein KP77_25360 [Jeotgalibacillus alimentarius]|uniref:Uncharacterized protein n=1 Tax=Jeotgalibacillus alimentarius TaxID=135826 RepID=A0A0C2VDE9_9BACL|nr:hypothetical protein [Jeotgalibacillus alimentarius]KIL46967.1 hypothetical protein KP77_25360 [Jeotgalibacillus alimentarius]
MLLRQAVNQSNELMAQSFRQELLAAGITENKKGRRIQELDFYELRNMVAINALKK